MVDERDKDLTSLRPGESAAENIAAIALDAAQMLAIVVPMLEQIVNIPELKNTDRGQRAFLYMMELRSRFEAHRRALKEITGG